MGPLFEIFHSAADPFLVQELSAALLDEFLRTSSGPGMRSRRLASRQSRLHGRSECGIAAVSPNGLWKEAAGVLCSTRPRRVVGLAEGLDRHHPASLLTVLLHLPRLIEQSGPEMDETIFLRKLGSLARLA